METPRRAVGAPGSAVTPAANEPETADVAARPDAPGEAPMLPGLRRLGAAVLVSVVIAGAAGSLLYAGALPVVPKAEAFARLTWWAVPGYALLFFTTLVLRAVRWRWLLLPIRPVRLDRLLAISFVFYGASITLPFRMGELVRPSLLYRKERISWWAATGTVGAERVIDGLVLSVLAFVALQVATPLPVLPDRIGDLHVPVSIVPRAAYSALALFAGLFTAMGLFYWRREWMRRTTRALVGPLSTWLAERLSDIVERLADGLRFLPNVRFTAPFLALTLAYWAIAALSVWLLLRGVGLDEVTFAQGTAVFAVLALGFLAPNAPGYFGVFQLSMYAGLAMYVPPELVTGPGSAAVFLCYSVQMVTVLLTAGIAVVVETNTPARAAG